MYPRLALNSICSLGDLKLRVNPLPPNYWDYKHVPLYLLSILRQSLPTSLMLVLNSWFSCLHHLQVVCVLSFSVLCIVVIQMCQWVLLFLDSLTVSGTQYVDQTSLELEESCVALPSKCWDRQEPCLTCLF